MLPLQTKRSLFNKHQHISSVGVNTGVSCFLLYSQFKKLQRYPMSRPSWHSGPHGMENLPDQRRDPSTCLLSSLETFEQLKRAKPWTNFNKSSLGKAENASIDLHNIIWIFNSRAPKLTMQIDLRPLNLVLNWESAS